MIQETKQAWLVAALRYLSSSELMNLHLLQVASVEVAVMGSAAVCAVSAASAAFAKRLSILRCAESPQNYLTSDLVLGCSGVVNLKWCQSHFWRYLFTHPQLWASM